MVNRGSSIFFFNFIASCLHLLLEAVLEAGLIGAVSVLSPAFYCEGLGQDAQICLASPKWLCTGALLLAPIAF